MNFMEFQTDQKLRGGYYTSEDLADFLVRWIARIQPTSILEPSCGDGVFFDRVASHLPEARLCAYEIEIGEANKAAVRAHACGLSDFEIHPIDFLGWATTAIGKYGAHFDAVIGNPPFIRYQYLPSLFQERAESVFRQLNCDFTRHTNAWVPFVMASFALLRPGGRLAMVVPAEIIHVMHARSLRSYLFEHARRMAIVDPEELWFSDTLQGAVLLLAEKKANSSSFGEGVGIYPVRGREFIRSDPETVFESVNVVNGTEICHKWTRALLDTETRTLLDTVASLESVYRFDEVGEVDVGIVTGANSFFLVNDETVERFGLRAWAHPMFGRSDHCPGVIYDESQHIANAGNGKPTNFLWFKDRAVEHHTRASDYISLGEYEGFNLRYKCRIRNPWYRVPSVYATKVGMLKRSHDAPRLILNDLQAFTTDTCYRIRTVSLNPALLVYSFVNPLTALSAELEGRHYGGGVLELVPSEIERVLIPLSSSISADLRALDSAVRSASMASVLERQGEIVLEGIGLSANDRDRILASWYKLRNRRHRVSEVRA